MQRPVLSLVGLVGLVALAALPSCKKEPVGELEAPPSPKEPEDAKKVEIPPLPPLELATAAPVGDRFVVLFRWGELRAAKLAPAAESIMVRLPDYLRVFSGTDIKKHGDLAGDVFSSLILSTSNPRSLLATTLAGRLAQPMARGSEAPKKMREMLTYKGSGVTWATLIGGRIGNIAADDVFPWREPRKFFVPARRSGDESGDDWILLTAYENLGKLAGMSPVGAGRTAIDEKSWPTWLRQALVTEAEGRTLKSQNGTLLVAANVQEIGALSLPGQLSQFAFPAINEATVAAFASGDGVVFQGRLRLADKNAAERIVALVSAAKLGIAMKGVPSSLPPGSANPLANIEAVADGSEVRWRTRATKNETRLMCKFAADQARLLMIVR